MFKNLLISDRDFSLQGEDPAVPVNKEQEMMRFLNGA